MKGKDSSLKLINIDCPKEQSVEQFSVFLIQLGSQNKFEVKQCSELK